MPRDLLGRSRNVDDDEDASVSLGFGASLPSDVRGLRRGRRRGTRDGFEGSGGRVKGDVRVEKRKRGDEKRLVLTDEREESPSKGR